MAISLFVQCHLSEAECDDKVYNSRNGGCDHEHSADDSGASGMNYLFLTNKEGSRLPSAPHDIQTVYLTSDTVLRPELTVKDFSSEFIADAEYVNALLAKLTLKQESMTAGETFSIRVLSSAYQNKNGNSVAFRLPIKNTMDEFEQSSIGRQVIASSYSDSGTCSIPLSKYGIIPFGATGKTIRASREPVKSVTVNGDCMMKFGESTLYVNGRDNGYLNIYLLEVPLDDVGYLIRITWDGYMSYSQNEANKGSWDVYFQGNVDFYLRMGKQGTNATGTYSMDGVTFNNPGPKGYVPFYRLDYLGTRFEVCYEKYDPAKHYESADIPYAKLTLQEALTETDTLLYFLKSDVDDDTYTVKDEVMSWPVGGSTYSTFYVSTNSWIGVTGSSEEIRINRKDAKAHNLLHGIYELTDFGIKCYKIC